MPMIERIGAALRTYAMYGRDNGKGGVEWFVLSTTNPWKGLSTAEMGSGIVDRGEARRAEMAANARAVLEAMREPTEAMCDAMAASDFEYWSSEEGEGRDSLQLDEAWRAGIDAALKEDNHGNR